jgi:hypothetical protein
MKAKAHRIGGVVCAALAGAALVAGGAQAADRPDDRAGLLGVGAAAATQSTPDAFERAVLRHAGATTAVPDAFERAVARQAPVAAPDAFERAVLRESATTPVRPDDRAGIRGPGIAASTAPVSVSVDETGFQWGDALFGAVAAIGAVLLAAAATLTIRHRGRVIMP